MFEVEQDYQNYVGSKFYEEMPILKCFIQFFPPLIKHNITQTCKYYEFRETFVFDRKNLTNFPP